MRVLVVTSEWPSEAHPHSGVFVARQAESLRRAGLEVDVEPFRGAKNPINYATARRRVRSRLRAGAYDLVHAHFGQSGLTVAPAPVPMVVTFHGSDLLGYVGRRGRYTAAGALLTRLSRLVARLADEVIVASEALGRRLPKGVRYTVIPVGADLEVFRPGPRDEARRKLGLPADGKLVLFGGSEDAPVKRYGLARNVVDLVSRDLPVELLTISGLPRETVAAYMQACDALLVTSLHEGAGTMVKEALACGLPVASVDVGDVRSVVEGVPGCVITEHDDPQTLASALGRVLASPPSASDPARAERWGDRAQTKKTIEVYERCLARTAA